MTIFVILAAGEGSRMRPITNTKPKPMVTVNGTSLIENQLTAISMCGVGKVVLVCGYLSRTLAAHVESLSLNVEVEYVVNKEYASTGSAYSLMLAMNTIKTECDVYVLEADVWMNAGHLKQLSSQDHSSVLVDKMGHSAVGSRIAANGEGYIDRYVHRDMHVYTGESSEYVPVNIVRILDSHVCTLRMQLKHILSVRGKTVPVEAGWDSLARCVDIKIVMNDSGRWAELDTVDELLQFERSL